MRAGGAGPTPRGNRAGARRAPDLVRRHFSADACDLLVDITIKAGDQRDDDHKCGDTHNHAEQRQCRAQLVRPDRCQGKFESFDEFQSVTTGKPQRWLH